MVHVNRNRTVFPATSSEVQQIKLSCFDLQMMFTNYIQKCLLYQTSAGDFSSHVERLAETLSKILVKYYPLAGRLTTTPVNGGIYILCNDFGVDFIEATAENLSIADLTAAEVTPAVEELFALNGAVNLEGHRLPLLVVQVNQLKDGVAVCCTINHAVVDGTSLWNLFNSWSHLCRTNGNGNKILVNPIFDRSLLQSAGSASAVRLGLDPDGHVTRFCPPLLRVKMFHFSAHAMSRLKEQAKQNSSCLVISSFQALCAHVWRAVTRARRLGPHDHTTFRLAVDCRPRFVPPLPTSYFGNVVQIAWTTATCGELLSLPLSFSAGLLNDIIAGHTDGVIRRRIDKWHKDPIVYRFQDFERNSLVIGGSPRFNMYDNDFGLGRPVAVRSGPANRSDGKMAAYPALEGGGCVELEICLPPSVMGVLERDPGFLAVTG